VTAPDTHRAIEAVWRLEKLGRLREARVEFERAAALTRNARERELLEARARACGSL
jgi:predicted RNA polymerase sigma factor